MSAATKRACHQTDQDVANLREEGHRVEDAQSKALSALSVGRSLRDQARIVGLLSQRVLFRSLL